MMPASPPIPTPANSRAGVTHPASTRAASPQVRWQKLLQSLASSLRDGDAFLGDTEADASWLMQRGADPSQPSPPIPPGTLDIAAGIVMSLDRHADILQKAHAARREALGRIVTRAPAVTSDRNAGDALRTQLADALQGLGRSLAERCRRTAASESGVQARMAAEVEKTSEADMTRESTRQAVRMSLSRGLQTDLQQAMRRHVEQDVRTMADEANQLLAEWGGLVDRTLRGDFGCADPCAIPRLQIEQIMERVEDQMQLNLRYRGLLPRRGFLQRLADGRKSIFTVLMFVSLFGSFVGFNWRTHAALGWVFMAGFLVAVAWTYRSWEEGDRERMEEELDKAREHLRMECRRALADVYRELQMAFVDTLETVRRTLTGSVDEVSRSAAAGSQRAAQTLREESQLSIRHIETRDAALAAWRQRIGRIGTELQALRAEGVE